MRKRIISESFENRMQELFGLIQENAHKIMKLGFDESIANYLANIDKKRGMFLADSLTQQYIKDKSVSGLEGQSTKQALSSIDQSELFNYIKSRENEILAISDWVKESQGQIDLRSFGGFNEISDAAQKAASGSGEEEINYPDYIENFLLEFDYDFGKELGAVALKTLVSFEHPELDVNMLSPSEMVEIVDERELFDFLKENDNELNYILDWMKAPVRQEEEGPLQKGFIAKNFNNIFEMFQMAKDWHEKIESTATGKVENPYKGKIVKRYGDDYYWIDLQTNNSPEESRAMGHCGTDGRATTLFSLRSTKAGESHITIAYNAKTNNVTQVKGRGNEKPSATGSVKYMPYVNDFLIDLVKRDKLFTFNWSYSPDLNKEEVENILSHMSAKAKFQKIKMSTPRMGIRGGNL